MRDLSQIQERRATSIERLIHDNEKFMPKNSYKCDICTRNFRSAYHLDQHKRNNHEVGETQEDTDMLEDEEGQWTCEKCGLKYNTKTLLLYHMRRKHNSDVNFQYTCQYCGLEYAKKNGLYKHMMRKHNVQNYTFESPKEKYKCKYCGTAYEFKQSLFRHMKTKHLEPDLNQIVYKCKFCGTSFGQRQNLFDHIKEQHDSEEIYSCEHCGFVCVEKNELVLHFSENHLQNTLTSGGECSENDISDGHVPVSEAKEEILQTSWWKSSTTSNGKRACKFCSMILSNGNRLRYHLKVKHPNEFQALKNEMTFEEEEKKYKCVICGLQYKNKMCLRYHSKLKHGDPANLQNQSYGCEYCGQTFKSTTYLKQHVKKKHDDDEDYVTSSVKARNKYKHVYIEKPPPKVSDDENVIACEEVPEPESADKSDLEKRYICDVCENTFTSISSLKHHKLAKHNSPSDKLYQCPHCSYCAKFNQYLQKHLASKHPDSDFAPQREVHMCTVCDYKSMNKYHYQRHFKSHFTEEKRFMCEFCDYRTNLQSSIIVHRRIHTKEKPYVCDIENCQYRCAQKTAMTIHQLSHNPEKNTQFCHLCSFKTVNKYLFKAHVNKHKLDDKEYKCDRCTFICKDSKSFESHKQIHMDNMMFKCSYCEFETHLQISLEAHIKSEHRYDQNHILPLEVHMKTEHQYIQSSLDMHMKPEHQYGLSSMHLHDSHIKPDHYNPMPLDCQMKPHEHQYNSMMSPHLDRHHYSPIHVPMDAHMNHLEHRQYNAGGMMPLPLDCHMKPEHRYTPTGIVDASMCKPVNYVYDGNVRSSQMVSADMINPYLNPVK